jgi:hypothetical protein
MITERLELQFLNEAGTRVTIGIADPKEDLTDEDVNNVMDLILQEDVFTSNRGDLVAKAGARIVTREVTEFNVE